MLVGLFLSYESSLLMLIDVFNGDADGICALLQLRLANPIDALLITGVKRDIALLQRVKATAGDKVTVLDISLDKNLSPLLALLQQGVDVFYADHHQASEVPNHSKLQALIDTDANVCTSLLIDRHLNHRFAAWAVTGAFGDNLQASAFQAAEGLKLSPLELNQLRQLGVCINYNAYGEYIEDLHIAPDQLYRQLSGFSSPFEFIAERYDFHQSLLDAYHSDMALAEQIQSEFDNGQVSVFLLPNEKWARRVSGVWSNALANANPSKAHAVLNLKADGDYQVSVRAPLLYKTGADELCMRFPTGGGRKAAAGINQLPSKDFSQFVNALIAQYSHAAE
jgi:hypothetical protein